MKSFFLSILFMLIVKAAFANSEYRCGVSLIFDSDGTDKEEVIDILISEKIIYKETSSLNSSHLIRSDVPMNFSLYRSLNKIYKSADVSTIKINLKEIIFEGS